MLGLCFSKTWCIVLDLSGLGWVAAAAESDPSGNLAWEEDPTTPTPEETPDVVKPVKLFPQ